MSDFAFSIPTGDSATLRLTLTSSDGSAPDLTGWSLTFSAGRISKTSGAGQVTVVAPGNVVTVSILGSDVTEVGTFDATLVAVSGVTQQSWYGDLAVFSASTRKDLTTIERVRAYLGVESFEPDSMLQQLITSSSVWITAQLGQEVLVRTVLETRDGDGETRLLLRQYPVNDIISLTVDGVPIPERTAVSGDGWILRDGGIDLVGYQFTSGSSNVVITYTAGHAVCPEELEQAVIEHVALRYRDRTRIGLGSQNTEDGSASYTSVGTLAFIQGVIDASPLKVWSVG